MRSPQTSEDHPRGVQVGLYARPISIAKDPVVDDNLPDVLVVGFIVDSLPPDNVTGSSLECEPGGVVDLVAPVQPHLVVGTVVGCDRPDVPAVREHSGGFQSCASERPEVAVSTELPPRVNGLMFVH